MDETLRIVKVIVDESSVADKVADATREFELKFPEAQGWDGSNSHKGDIRLFEKRGQALIYAGILEKYDVKYSLHHAARFNELTR